MKKIVKTDGAPEAIGPYSQGVVAGPFLFCAGQLPKDPKTDQMETADIGRATEIICRNLEAVCKAAGASLSDAAKAVVYLVDLKDFQGMNEVYARFFPKDPPARVTIQVAALPAGARVEIELTVLLPAGK